MKTRFILAGLTALIVSACSSPQQIGAPVVSGTNSSGYSYNNGSVNTPYGTYNNGTINTPYGSYNNGTISAPTNNTSNTPYIPASNSTTTTTVAEHPYTPSVNNAYTLEPTASYTPQNTNTNYQPTPAYSSVGNYPPVDINATYHHVVAGDTVYNISKRYNISQDNLRLWNNLPDNNIKLGQRLRVKPQGYSGSSTSYAPTSGTTHRVVAGDTLYNIAKRYGVSQNQIREWNHLSGDNVQLGQVLRVSARQSVNHSNNYAAATPKTITQPIYTTPANVDASVYTPSNAQSLTNSTPANTPTISTNNVKTNRKDGITWQNPVLGGQISQTFGGNNRGMEITGSKNQPVVAAADGQVIYSGQGPRGYGNLVIVQHNQKYLTAYGHNEKLLVKEKDQVKRGQSLATLGNNGKLHFEIREDGTPVNPTHFVLF